MLDWPIITTPSLFVCVGNQSLGVASCMQVMVDCSSGPGQRCIFKTRKTKTYPVADRTGHIQELSRKLAQT